MKKESIVLLAGKWDTTAIVFNYLNKDFYVEKVIIENGVSRKEFIQKRIKKLGWLTVCGQVLFQIFIGKPLSFLSKSRIEEINKVYQLDKKNIPPEKVIYVSSVNGSESLKELQKLSPNIIVVHGTRIISKRILHSVSVPFINIHAGITPKYRGSHGAYWALVNNDSENCGVTVHFVDAGIDTGNIIGQEIISITKQDNFATYPYIQLALGLGILVKALKEYFGGKNIVGINNDLKSGLWHHPTLIAYLKTRILKGIK
jgi:folate-dependent phosphoribosylglycinamide formyltransferase PurN